MVNKNSLRLQLETFRENFAKLKKDGKTNPELDIFIDSLLVLMNLMAAIFLEKTHKKTSNNSHIPSSKSDPDLTNKTQKKHKQQEQEKSPLQGQYSGTKTITLEEECKVELCQHCGHPLEDESCCGHEERILIDIEYTKVVRKQKAEIKNCPKCGKSTKGKFSPHFHGPLQYGMGVVVYALHIMFEMVAIKRIQDSLRGMFGINLSQATVLGYMLKMSVKLQRWEEEVAIKSLLASPVMHVDETGITLNKKKWWIYTFSTGDTTVQFARQSRGLDALRDIGILQQYKGVAVHDCLTMYFNEDISKNFKNHAICGAHLKRELQEVIDIHKHKWARHMQKLLISTCAKINDAKNSKLSKKEYATLQQQYRSILTKGKKELPPEPERVPGQRGKLAQCKARNLHDRFVLREEYILLFAKVSEVPFTNNRAERDLRMVKVKKKVSGTFRSEKHLHAFCRIYSYLKTMKYHNFNPIYALEKAWLQDFHFLKRG